MVLFPIKITIFKSKLDIFHHTAGVHDIVSFKTTILFPRSNMFLLKTFAESKLLHSFILLCYRVV